MGKESDKKILILFTALVVGVSFHIGLTRYRQNTHKAFWANQPLPQPKDKNRAPSAIFDFNPDSMEIYRDYFTYKDFQKYLSYSIKIKFRSEEKDPERIKQSKEAFKESIRDTLIHYEKSVPEEGIESFNKGLTHLIKENLSGQLVKNFRERLNLEKGRSAYFQVDLDFYPQIHPEFGYKKELATNNLVNWHHTGDLKDSLIKNEEPLHKHVYQTPVPLSTENYQYKGGQITIWFEIKPNDHHGFVRYRRYFRARDLANTDPFINDKDFRLTMVHFKKNNVKNPLSGRKENFVTVDIFKEFEADSPKPTLDKVELTFGKLLPDHFYKDSYRNDFVLFEKDTFETGELNLYGVVHYHDKELIFTSRIEKLIFDFKSGQFSKKSQLKTTFKNATLSGTHLGAVQHKIQQKLLKEHALPLIQSFKLGEIHSKFGGRL